jgi:O-antigen/teichoic acid export membrane protein
MIRKLLKDSFSCAAVPFVKMAITFIMTPVIVHALGNYDYGVWEMVFAIIGYLEFLDLGLMPAIVRNVARFQALKDREELQRIYSTSMAFFLPVGLLLAIGLIAFSLLAPNLIMKGPDPGSQKYTLFFIIIGIQIFFVFVGSVFDCCLEGFMLYNVRNYTTMVLSVVGAVIMYPLLKNGGGLLALAVVNACGFSLKYLFYGFLLSRERFGGLRFRVRHVSRKTFKGLFQFGLKSFIWASSLRISILSDPLVIGSVLGAALVPFYMIPVNLVSQARGIVWSITRVFLPAFSGLDALDEKEKSRDLYYGASRFMLGIVVPMIGGICLLGPAFISHWMGPEYAENGKMVLYIIAAAYLIQWLNPFSRRFLTAIDRHEILAKAGMISAALNLGLSITFVHFIGKEGVALGTLLPVLLFEPYFLYRTCQELRCSVWQYSRNVFVPLLIPALFFVITLAGAKMFFPADSLAGVALLAILSVVAYAPVFAATAMKREERQKVYRQIRQRVLSGAFS